MNRDNISYFGEIDKKYINITFSQNCFKCVTQNYYIDLSFQKESIDIL